jgi:hypothetical protein
MCVHVCVCVCVSACLCPVARKDEPAPGACVCACVSVSVSVCPVAWTDEPKKTYFPTPALQSARQPRCVHSAFSAYEASAVDSVSSGSSFRV